MSALEQLRKLEANITAAEARQRDLRAGKEAAARDVGAARAALVSALEKDLDASATAERKALASAEKRASEPWTERMEAAGRLVAQAQRKHGGLHPPIPAGVPAIRIEPTDDPDDDVREQARAWFSEQPGKAA